MAKLLGIGVLLPIVFGGCADPESSPPGDPKAAWTLDPRVHSALRTILGNRYTPRG